MTKLALILLAALILPILLKQFLLGTVLAGLLAVLTILLSRMEALQRSLDRLQAAGDADRHDAKPEPASSHGVSPSPASPPSSAPPLPAASRARTGDTPAAATKAAQPPAPSADRRPSTPVPPVWSRWEVPPFVRKLFDSVWRWFTTGNVFVRVGIVILFLGMSFLVRYAFSENLIPPSVQLAGVAAVALGLLYWGWCQRLIRPVFSLVVQGGGIGLLYLTIFSAFSIYKLIPSLPAFALLAATVALAALLAVLQDARRLALFATVGGFFAPVLTSSGSNNYIGLFSYYTLLNLGVFAIAWFKSWRLLNLAGFVLTFGVATTWGALKYEKAFFATTEPFLVVFFLLYVAISILFANRRRPFYRDYVDSSLVFGTPLIAFGLQCAMVNDYRYGVAVSAAVLGAFYVLLARVVWRRYGEGLRLLAETFLSLGVVFLTLAIPFAVDGTLTGATWAIEGAGILWVSIKQQQKYRRLFGAALVFLAGAMLAYELVPPVDGPAGMFPRAFINSAFIGWVIIALSAGVCSWLLSRPFPGKLPAEAKVGHALLIFGPVALLAGFEYQILDFQLYGDHGVLLAALTGVYVAVCTTAGVKLVWRQAHWVAVAFVTPLVVAAVLCYAYQSRLGANHGYVTWPPVLLTFFYALKRARSAVNTGVLTATHVCVAAVIVGLLFWEGLWQLLLGYTLLAVVFNEVGGRCDWHQLKVLALGLLPVLALVALAAIGIDGDLVTLSSIAAGLDWAFPPGYLLWPLAFVAYFYVLYQNPVIFGLRTTVLHYGGALLIGLLLLWLGLWPLLLGGTLLSALTSYLWQRLSWPEMRVTSLGLLPALLTILLIKLFATNPDPFDIHAFNVAFQPGFEFGYFLWPLAFAVLFWTFHRFDRQGKPAPALQHGLSIVSAAWLITWEASWHVLDHVAFMNGWHLALLPVTTMLALRLILVPPSWPFTTHGDAYRRVALVPLGLALAGWSLLQLFSPAASGLLPWLPLANPVSVVQAMIVMAALAGAESALAGFANPPSRRNIRLVLTAFMFVWANVELLRGVHYWGNVPWEVPTLLTSNLSQTALSLFWALCGLGVTLYAGRRSVRNLWIFGAGLLAAVILKLFLIDLSATGTVERIVSFTGVGLLLVLVGYFSPLPPKAAARTAEIADG